MADHVDITLWIDRRWKDAIEKHLKGETLQEHLENVLIRCATSSRSRNTNASVPRSTQRMPQSVKRGRPPAPTPPTM